MNGRRIIVSIVLVLVALPVAFAADLAEREREGGLVVRFADPRIGEEYTYDLFFTSRLHDLDVVIEDYTTIRVEGIEQVEFADGTAVDALAVSQTKKISEFDDTQVLCVGDCGGWQRTGTQTDRWLLRIPDGIVIERHVHSDVSTYSQQDGAWEEDRSVETIVMPNGNTFPSVYGVSPPDSAFVYGPSLARATVALLTDFVEGADLRAVLDGDQVYRVRHRNWDSEASSTHCGLDLPSVSYFDWSEQREDRNVRVKGESSTWLRPGLGFPVLSTCVASTTEPKTGEVTERVELRMRLKEHVPGHTPVHFEWADDYHDTNARFKRPAELPLVATSIPGAPRDDDAGLRFPLSEALHHVSVSDDATLARFRDDDMPHFAVKDLLYTPSIRRQQCEPPTGIPDPLGLLVGAERAACETEYATWDLWIVNRRNAVLNVSLELPFDSGGRPMEIRIVSVEGPDQIPEEGIGVVHYEDIPTELATLGAALSAWQDVGLLPSDWQTDGGYTVRLWRSFWGSLTLRYSEWSGPFDQQTQQSWSDGYSVDSGRHGWYQTETDYPDREAAPTDPAVASTGTVERLTMDPHVPVAAGVTLGAFLLALVAYVAWPLVQKVPFFFGYAKISRSELLDHETRDAISNYLRTNPGSSTTQVQHALSLPYSTTTHHLAKLKEHGLARDTKVGKTRAWYVTDAPPPSQTDILVQRPAVARTYAAIQAEPGITQQKLAARLGVAKTSIQLHTRQLLAAGGLTQQRKGRSVQYWPAGNTAAR